MIKATKLQEEYRRHLHRINTDYSKAVPVSDGDAYINEAIDTLFENFAAKYQVNDLVTNHLRKLEVISEEIPHSKVDEKSDEIYFPEEYYKLTSQKIVACKTGCDQKRILDIHIVPSGNINSTRLDSLKNSSWEWSRAIGQITNSSLTIFHDCEYNIASVIISYLRRPQHIATPSKTTQGYYISSDGRKVDRDIDFEMDSSFFWRKVVELAAINTALDLGDTTDFSLRLQKLLTTDKLFLQ